MSFFFFFCTNIENEGEKNIDAMNYNHSTKRLLENTTSYHMFNFSQTLEWLNARSSFVIVTDTCFVYDDLNNHLST